MTKVTITVTEDDLRDGAGGGGNSCPVWCAVRRAAPGIPGLHIGQASIFARDVLGTSVIIADLPRVASDFIERFDMEDPDGDLDPVASMVPFNFDVDIPDDLLAVTA